MTRVLERSAGTDQNYIDVIRHAAEVEARTHRVLKRPSIAADEQGVSVTAPEPAGGDWLDVCCWRCGEAEASSDPLGRLLCRPCRAELSDTPATLPDDPLRVVRGAYWDAHALERCWRCLIESVDPVDDVGLCGPCLASLAAAQATSAEDVAGR